jgi:hypothetical protein
LPASLHACGVLGDVGGIDDKRVKKGLTFEQKNQKIAASRSSCIQMMNIL